MRLHGVGVKHFREYPKANRFIYESSSLSSSEWTQALKLNIGYANLLGVTGVQTVGGLAATLCRRCHKEKETLSHVLGFCPYGEFLRNRRHHKLKNKLAELLRSAGYHCVVEAHCKDGDGDGRNRFVDILAAKAGSPIAFVIDPTVRWESNHDVGEIVQREKASIYESCAADLRSRYTFIGRRQIEVVGIWWGARGSISTQVVDFFTRTGLDKSRLSELGESVLISSIHMVHHHIYGAH